MYKLTEPGRSPESNRQLQAAPSELSKLQSEDAKPRAVGSQHRFPIPGISGVPQIPPGSPRPQTPPRNAHPFEKGLALQQPSLPAWGLGAPTPDCLLPHKHRPAHNRTLLPQTKAQTPILSPRVQRRSPSDAEMLGPSWVFTPSWACQRDPRPSPQRVAAEGFPLRYHLPQLTSPGGHGPGCLARSVSLL